MAVDVVAGRCGCVAHSVASVRTRCYLGDRSPVSSVEVQEPKHPYRFLSSVPGTITPASGATYFQTVIGVGRAADSASRVSLGYPTGIDMIRSNLPAWISRVRCFTAASAWIFLGPPLLASQSSVSPPGGEIPVVRPRRLQAGSGSMGYSTRRAGLVAG